MYIFFFNMRLDTLNVWLREFNDKFLNNILKVIFKIHILVIFLRIIIYLEHEEIKKQLDT